MVINMELKIRAGPRAFVFSSVVITRRLIIQYDNVLNIINVNYHLKIKKNPKKCSFFDYSILKTLA